jgi:DNA-binding NarL/FixJ family response regulator
LTAARDTFERLGAGPWYRQASEELRRIGLRPRAPATLTDGEALVARLAAGGSPNRAIASAVFLSPKTVEATLSRVYLKLGIRGRAELGVHLAALGREGDATGAGD